MSIEGVLQIVSALFYVLGGITVFMIGMDILGANLEKAAGSKMRHLIGKATKNKFVGIATGTAITAIIQSSSATTVMVVGFVNIGMMTLIQATSIIMGANIGTTITAFLSALSMGGAELEISAVFAFIAFVGLMMTLFSKQEKTKRIGFMLAGLGMVFIGLYTMSFTVSGLTEGDGEVAQAIKGMFAAIGNGADTLTWQILVLFLLGLVLTGIMQSSSAITAIVITLASEGLISLHMALFIVLGTNIGTCFTAVISSIGTSVNARRAACIHLCFNIIGCVIFAIPTIIWGGDIARLLESWMPGNVTWQIAIFHLVFNATNTIILMWFIPQLVKLACFLVRDKSEHKAEQGEETENDEILDNRLLKTPAIAVGQARKEIVKMGQLAFSNYKLALEMLLGNNLGKKSVFEENEKHIDDLNRYITQFLVKLSSEDIAEIDERKVSSFYHVASDIERIGDYAENIVEYAEEMIKAEAKFSDHAVEEITEMDGYITELYKNVEMAFANHNLSYTQNIENAENEVDRMCFKMKEAHIRRTNEGRCSSQAGSVYLQLAVNMERIGDHMNNIANSIKTYVDPAE